MQNEVVREINIVPIKPRYGLIAFASFVIFESFYISSVAIYTRPGGGIRLVYPRKRNQDMCHPINADIGAMIENAVYGEMMNYELI